MVDYRFDGLDKDSPNNPFIIDPRKKITPDINISQIEKIIRKEEEERRDQPQQPQLPLYLPDRPPETPLNQPPKPNQGVVIITPEDNKHNPKGYMNI